MKLLLIILILLSCSDEKNLKSFLLNNGFEIIKNDSLKGFKESYTMRFKQTLDHEKKKGSFYQYLHIAHRDKESVTVFETEGYALRKHNEIELTRILDANQIQIEYRFYGKSKPDSLNFSWNYLTNKQATEDYHRLMKIFKKYYQGKFVSTGVSKGGETTLIYKSFYPKDVDASVPYVAPMILGQEDKRADEFLNTVSTSENRKRLINFQRMVLKNKPDILPYLKRYAKESGLSFKKIGYEAALEYSVLEFTFSFWQWGHDINQVPVKKQSIKSLFDVLSNISGFWLYSDQGIKYFEPSFYQHMKELGYYGFNWEEIKDLLSHVKSRSNRIFAPENVNLDHNKNFIPSVLAKLNENGDKILFVYGDYDPWFSCAVIPGPGRDVLKMVKSKGSHATRIKDFSENDKEKIFKKLEEWLSIEIKNNPLEKVNVN